MEYRLRPSSTPFRSAFLVGWSVQLLDRAIDVGTAVFYGLDVQAPFRDPVIADGGNDDPAHLETRSIGVVAVPVDLAPLDIPIAATRQELGLEVRDAGENGRPVSSTCARPTKVRPGCAGWSLR